MILVTSCDLKEKFEKMMQLKKDLAAAFHHEDVNLSMHRGTRENDNYTTITFYSYPVETTSYKELDTLANKVESFLHRQDPESRKLDCIEIKFTKEPSSSTEAASFISFKKVQNSSPQE
ncbi:hypothetical protein TH61_14715 [Rufibacter sp. DG15C]|nr:hypothetical protein TH61_14715 [Rufibacter sp. DG15C]